MKKNYSLLLTLLLAFSGMMLLTACSDDDEKDPVKPTKSYLEYLKEDYAMVTSRFPNAVGKFVEAQYELNGKVSELAAKDLKVINVTYIYNLGWDEDLGESMIIYHERDFEDGSTPLIFMYNSHSPWMEDKLIPNFDGFISLEQAIENVKNADIEDPETAFITLRHPVIEFDKGHALYVFGGSPDRDKHVFVDAISGEVYELDK